MQSETNQRIESFPIKMKKSNDYKNNKGQKIDYKEARKELGTKHASAVKKSAQWGGNSDQNQTGSNIREQGEKEICNTEDRIDNHKEVFWK